MKLSSKVGDVQTKGHQGEAGHFGSKNRLVPKLSVKSQWKQIEKERHQKIAHLVSPIVEEPAKHHIFSTHYGTRARS